MFFLKEGYYSIDTNGILLSPEITTATAFSEELQDELWELEDNSWWFQYRAELILGFMMEYFDKNTVTVDVGGGNGFSSKIAKENGYTVGMVEPSFEACRHAKIRGIDTVFCGTIADEAVIDNSINQILLLDVLEHIEDDKDFLKTLNRKISNTGYCIITVPAFKCLWSSEDDSAGHFRRYTISRLSDVVEDSGFEICYASYFMSFLFAPIIIVRVLFEKIGLIKKQSERSEEERRRIAQAQFESKGGLVKTVLSLFEKIEKMVISKKGKVCFGSSIIMVVRNKMGESG